MTLAELSALPDDQLRVICAKRCGWTFLPQPENGASTANWRAPNNHYKWNCPNYPSSLDAMAQAEKTLTDEQKETYPHILADVIGPTKSQYWTICHSSARQRCIAFLAATEPR